MPPVASPSLLIVGPPTHGVTRLARELSTQLALAGLPATSIERGADADWSAVGSGLGAGTAHVHFTDRLFGTDAPHAAQRFLELAAVTPVSVTLHDLPQPSDGAESFGLRTRAYAAVAAAAEVVVVSSEHERMLWQEALAAHPVTGTPRPDDLHVIPLPVTAPGTPPRTAELTTRPHREVAVVGFLYPGKGHEEALDAVLDLPDDVGLAALGTASPGHEDLADALARRAAAAGRPFRLTGYLTDARLLREMRSVAVPVAPHRHISASGSLASWISAGRRPVVPAGRYVDELEARCPGLLNRYDDAPGALAAACREALDHPRVTLLPPNLSVGPGPSEVAARYAALLSGRRSASSGAPLA